MSEYRFRTLALAFDPRGVATLSMRRGVDEVVIDELLWAFALLIGDARVRVVVLQCDGSPVGEGASGLASLMSLVGECRKPVVLTVRGVACSALIGLCCVSDVVLAARGSSFAIHEQRGDGAPAVIAPYLLEIIGRREAQRLSLTGQALDAARAVALQLVTEVVPEPRLDSSAHRLALLMLGGGHDRLLDAKTTYRPVERETAAPPAATSRPASA